MPDPLRVVLERLFVALAVGFLIGLDRERAEERKQRTLFAGVRTFPLIALVGAIPLLLGDAIGPPLAVASFAGVAAIAGVSYLRSSAAGDIGATTEIAALVTFLLGALAGTGQLLAAGAAGVAVAVLLHVKPRLERFSRTLDADEMRAALELAVISVIVLPLLPDRGFGPWEVWNPREIWLVVVMVSALSFAGFVAIRLLGEQRGMLVTGATGGLVSSTAVTMAMAERSRTSPTLARSATAAAVLASTVMCARIVVLAGAVNVGLLPLLLPVMGAMGAAGMIAAWLLARTTARTPTDGKRSTRNPFSLTAAITFGGIYAVVLLVVRGAQERLGDAGILAGAALAGTVDVDAPTIACARLAGSAIAPTTAVLGITGAAIANTLVKGGLALGLGAPPFGRLTAAVLGGMALLGGLAAAAVGLRG